MSAPLTLGLYHIFSKIRDRPVGRRLHEDKSLLPKPIVVLKHEEIQERTFEFRPTPRPHEFHIKSLGADVGVVDGKLVALLIDPGEPVAFTITLQLHQGEQFFTIERAHTGTGWVAREEDDTQIEVRPLIVGPSDPPFHPPTQLFRIVPVN